MSSNSQYANLTYSIHVRTPVSRGGVHYYDMAVTVDQVGRSWDYFREEEETDDLIDRLAAVGIDAEYEGPDVFVVESTLDPAAFDQALSTAVGVTVRPDRNIVWEFGVMKGWQHDNAIFVLPVDKVKDQDQLDEEESSILDNDLATLGLNDVSNESECMYSFDWNGSGSALKKLLINSGKFVHNARYDQD